MGIQNNRHLMHSLQAVILTYLIFECQQASAQSLSAFVQSSGGGTGAFFSFLSYSGGATQPDVTRNDRLTDGRSIFIGDLPDTTSRMYFGVGRINVISGSGKYRLLDVVVSGISSLASPNPNIQGPFSTNNTVAYNVTNLSLNTDYFLEARYVRSASLNFNLDRLEEPLFYSKLGEWKTFLSGNNVCNPIATFAAQTVSNTYPSPGWFDLDAFPDLGYFDKSNANWVSRSSLTGQTSSLGVYGVPSTDVPAVEDFDRDGVSDRTVFRNSGAWYSIYSSLLYNSGSLIQDTNVGNLQVVTPLTSGLGFYNRNDAGAWSGPVVFASAAKGNPSLIKSNDGNLQVVVPVSGGLANYSRRLSDGVWVGPSTTFATQASGNPSLIQASNSTLQVVVPVAGGLGYYNRDAAGTWFGPVVFAPEATGDPSLIKASDGYLQVVVPVAGGLAHYYRRASDGVWLGPTAIFATQAAGKPALIQASANTLQVVVPLKSGGLGYYNRDAAGTWFGPTTFAAPLTGSPSLIKSNDGNFQVIVPGLPSGLVNYARRTSDGVWIGPGPAFAQVAGRGALIGTYGQAGDEPYPGDYDGDGKADLSVIRRGQVDGSGYYYDTWFIKRSSDGVSVSYNFSDNPATTPVRPRGFLVPGDYDGDGKVDPAVQRVSVSGSSYSTNLYYIASSGGGTVKKTMSLYSGAVNNTYLGPLTGDFDGDGKSDFAGFLTTLNRIQYLASASGDQLVTTASGCGYGTNTIVNFTPQGIRAPYISPVLIDTEGDGFDLTSPADGVSFDFQGYGQVVKSSWTAAGSDEAFLVLDHNRNDTIESGLELFGNETVQPANVSPNGFLALSMFDKPDKGGNGDGLIDASDSVFTELRLWIDADHDGVSTVDELIPVTDKGISAFELRYKESKRVDRYGNRFRYRARVLDERGAQNGRWAWDVFFRIDTSTAQDGTAVTSDTSVFGSR